MKTIKKFLSGFLTASLLSASFVIPTFAENDISVILNGNAIGFDVPPQIINERTMVPLRAIFEALGASVDWNGDTRTVTSEKDGTTISLTIDSSTMYVNGNAVALDSPGCIIDGRTLVPVRAISEAYGTEVGWDGNTRTVSIKSNNKNINEEPTPTPKPEAKGGIILGQEYGPMIVHCSTSERTNNISSLKFTSFEYSSLGKDSYKVTMKMKGIVDYTFADVYVYFYDDNNDVLGEEWFTHKVSPNTDYNVSISCFIDAEIIDNATHIAFYSDSGEKATITKTTPNTNNNKADNSTSTSKTTKTNKNTSNLSEYENLKNQLIENGIYIERTNHYSIICNSANTTYNCWYAPDDEEIVITASDTKHETFTSITLTKKNNPKVMYSQSSSGRKYILSGEFVNSKFVTDVSSMPFFDDAAVMSIQTSLMIAENEFHLIGFDIDFESLGIPLS